METKAIWVYITCRDEAEALRLARHAVEEELAACGNLLGPIRSIFRWQGKIEESAETALVLKTRSELFERLRQRMAGLHSYECPCIVALPIVDGHPPFLAWIREPGRS